MSTEVPSCLPCSCPVLPSPAVRFSRWQPPVAITGRDFSAHRTFYSRMASGSSVVRSHWLIFPMWPSRPQLQLWGWTFPVAQVSVTVGGGGGGRFQSCPNFMYREGLVFSEGKVAKKGIKRRQNGYWAGKTKRCPPH